MTDVRVVARRNGDGFVDELCCAFVGCGEISRRYLSVYAQTPGVRVSICIDSEIERAELAAALLNDDKEGVTTRSSRDFKDALADGIDVVIINTPNHLHREQAVAALENGKHVLLQKPLAATMADALAINDAAARARGTAGMYMSYFDQPIVHDLHDMARAGWFGSITQIHARLMHPGGLLWSRQAVAGSRSWRGSIEETGGGAFIQLAVHYLRIASWILNEPVVRLSGFASNLHCPGLEGEDTGVAILEYQSGCMATFNVSWCTQGEELSIHGTEGALTYLDNRQVKLCSTHDFTGHVVNYRAPGVDFIECAKVSIGDGIQPFNQHRLFLEALRTGRSPFMSVEAGVEDMKVVTAFYEAVRTGGPVTVGFHPS